MSRPSRGGDVAVSRPLRVALRGYFTVFLLVLYLPTALLVLFSFNDKTTATFPLRGFPTFRFYERAWSNPDITGSVRNSFEVATFVGIFATILGLGASYVLARRKVVLKGPISALLLVPLVVPTVALGIALLILFNQWFPSLLGLKAVFVGHVVLALPYTILLILPRIGSIDRRLEEAAQDLGASAGQTFRRVILPLAVPSLLAAFLISFIISVDEVVVANFLLGQGQLTYPVYLFAGLRQPDRVADLIPVASAMILLSFLIAFLAETLRRRGERRLGLAS